MIKRGRFVLYRRHRRGTLVIDNSAYFSWRVIISSESSVEFSGQIQSFDEAMSLPDPISSKRKFEAYTCADDVKDHSNSIETLRDEAKRRQLEDARISGFGKGNDLYLFVKMMTGKTLGFCLDRYDAVVSLSEKIESAVHVPVWEQRLIYGGRQLELDKSFAEYGIERDSTIQLVGRLRSRENLTTWRVVDGMVNSAIRLCKGESDLEVHKDVIRGMRKFLGKNKNDDVDDDGGDLQLSLSESHFKIFSSLAAEDVLSMLLLSPIRNNRQTGYKVIEQFITTAGSLPVKLHAYAARVVLQFCKRLGTRIVKEPLYYLCRSTLGSLLGAASEHCGRHGRKSVSLDEMFSFVIEIGNKLVTDLAKSTPSPIDMIPLFQDVQEFNLFLTPTLTHLLKMVDVDEISLLMRKIVVSECPSYGIIYNLHQLFRDLLHKMDTCLLGAEHSLSLKGIRACLLTFVGDPYLLILKTLDTLSKIYKDEAGKFTNMLERRKFYLHALILGFTNRGENNNWLLEHKDILDFDCRRHLIMMMIPDIKEEDDGEVHEMLIDRSQLLTQSFEYLLNATPEELRAGLYIQFINEEATGPGVVREWFSLICKAIFSPENGLFVANPNDQRRFYINPASKEDPMHLDYLQICGRLIGLALMYQVQVGIVFDLIFYKQLAEIDVQLVDIRDTDPTLYRSCKQILDMDADLVDSDALGLKFVIETEEYGSRQTVELVPGGGLVKVNSTNRIDYVDALIRSRFLDSTSIQVEYFATGFQDILLYPENMSLFFRSLEPEELDQMLSGSVSDISFAGWKAQTDCKGYKDTDPQIIWFWKIVDEMSTEQRRQLLFFWTAIKYLPVDGFSGLSSRLEIHKSETTTDHLPSSHTCFYQLCLPEYPTYDVMQRRLSVVTQEHVANSFGCP